MDRMYQPSLFWSHVEDYLRAKDPDREIIRHEQTLYIYVTNKSGAYQMSGPKLYWTDEPMTGAYFQNCDQDALYINREHLGEVVVYDRKTRSTEILGKDYIQAWEKVL